MGKPEWYCECWSRYPNEAHRHKNGRWKCVERYKCIRQLVEPLTNYYDQKTHCVRIREDDKDEYALSVTEKYQDVQAE